MRTPSPSALLGSISARGASAVLLLTPAAVLGLVAAKSGSGLLAAGAALALVGGLMFFRAREAWRPPTSASVVLLYLISLGWLWAFAPDRSDGLARFGRGGLLMAAVGLLAVHDLARTGLGARRRAVVLVRRVRGRLRWPVQVSGFAALPEVRALQEAVRDDPVPALELLADPRPQLRAAGFTALQGRDFWRPAEAAVVLDAVRTTYEPPVRAAGLAALAGATDPDTLTEVTGYLRDPAAEVREATASTLLAAGGARWPLVREAVREALADQRLAPDGPLPGGPGRLPAVAVCDLTAWATEADPLSGRSIRTLVEHYATVLKAGTHPELGAELGHQVIDPQTPPALRVELAGLLRGLGLIPPALLDRMTDVDQPSPIRLLAAEILLSADPADPDAIDVLRGLGRQSNRETALAIARMLQGYLGLDLGLPDEPVSPGSKAAAEVAKLVFQWATGRPAPPPPAEAGSAWVTRPVARPALPGLKQTAVPPRTQPPPDARGSKGSQWAPR